MELKGGRAGGSSTLELHSSKCYAFVQMLCSHLCVKPPSVMQRESKRTISTHGLFTFTWARKNVIQGGPPLWVRDQTGIDLYSVALITGHAPQISFNPYTLQPRVCHCVMSFVPKKMTWKKKGKESILRKYLRGNQRKQPALGSGSTYEVFTWQYSCLMLTRRLHKWHFALSCIPICVWFWLHLHNPFLNTAFLDAHVRREFRRIARQYATV